MRDQRLSSASGIRAYDAARWTNWTPDKVPTQLASPHAPRPFAGGLSPLRAKRVMDFMLAHLSEDIALSDVAAIAGLSPHHFCRAFKQSTGLSPHASLALRRMECAQSLMIEHPFRGLTEIALCVGYQSQAAFGTAFKRVTGRTPGQWRRERLS